MSPRPHLSLQLVAQLESDTYPIINYLMHILIFIYEEYQHAYHTVRQTSQNDVSIRFSTGSVEERINMSLDISENTMEHFLKNVKYTLLFSSETIERSL